ncbi:transcriptional regulator, partial [Streptomyces sp. A7024]
MAGELLLRLAEERASGAVLCDAGTVFLRDGAVVHAESPAAPGVEALLIGGGLLPADRWQEAIDAAGARNGVARHLVDSGRVGAPVLEMLHLSAVYDAAYFALAAGSTARRFRAGVAHWLGPVCPVTAPSLLRESARRAELLASLWPHPQLDQVPVVRRDPPRPPMIGRRQRTVLDAADGKRTPSVIARLLARPAFHTLLDVRRLAAAGLIATPRPRPP